MTPAERITELEQQVADLQRELLARLIAIEELLGIVWAPLQ